MIFAARASGGAAPRHGAGRVAEAVDRIARKIAVQLDLAELMASVVAEVQEALDAEGAAVLLVEGGALRFAGATGPGAGALLGRSLPLTTGVCGEVVRRQAPAVVTDGATDPRIARQIEAESGFATRTMVAAPLVVHGTTIGVVEAVNRRSTSRPFGEEDLHFLDRLAPHVAAAVSNATFASELRRSRDELARHAEELEQKVQRRTAAIASAKREWELTFDSIEDPLAIIEDGKVRRANLAYARAQGIDIRTVTGRSCFEARFGRSSPCPGCPLLSAKAGDAATGELELPEGSFTVRGFRIADPERPNAWVVSYHDVTEQRRLASKLREAAHHGAIGRLAAGAAHEINNPMAFVTAALRSLRENVGDLAGLATLGGLAAELAASGRTAQALGALGKLATRAGEVDLPEVARDALEILDEADVGARRVTEIVRALKVLGRDELGYDERFELSVCLDRAAERARRIGPFPGKLSWTGRGAAELTGRPLQLDQALFEIVRNAGQALRGPDGVVELSCETGGGFVTVEIADDGAGIDPENLPRVCEPFFTTRGVGGGVGLGLTIAYGVVRRHGGELTVLPRPAGGTLVRLRLPVDHTDQADEAAGRSPGSP